MLQIPRTRSLGKNVEQSWLHFLLTAVQLWTAGDADNRGMDLELPRLMLWHNFCPARAQSRIRHLCKKVGKVTLGGCKSLVMADGDPIGGRELSETVVQSWTISGRDFPLPMSAKSQSRMRRVHQQY